MLNLKTIIPQASRAIHSESRTDTSVSLTDSGGGKSSTKRQKLSKTKHSGRNKKMVYIASYNIRTMRSEEHLTNLEKELQNIKWDILGISETRLSGEAVTILKLGHLLFQRNSNENAHIGGVTLMIHKRMKHLVTKTKMISDRVIYIIFKINSKYNMQIIQAYAPTSASTNEENEAFYEGLTAAKNTEKAKFTIIIGDFNAKVGAKAATDLSCVGAFGLGKRNRRGQAMVDFLNKEGIYCLNTFFEKQHERKWTWRSPDNTVKNEIDYVLVIEKRICMDVSVLNRFDTGSDHRLVRAKLQIDTRMERRRLIAKKIRPTLYEMKEKKDEFNTQMDKKLRPTEELWDLELNEVATKITNSIQTAVKKVCSMQKSRNRGKIGPDTENLIKERRKTDRDSQKYKNLNKVQGLK
ncbi:craniofacial development protein 2-like [Polyergus mexicanus]|uniref:craniofacial development protein 2-like n=1 Tax=Polyergus mexicanus TaxID=615972 RepID=UPI0038B5D3DC